MALHFYRCNHCGNIIIKTHDSKVPVMCCGEKMALLVPNTGDGAGEKHVPYVSRDMFHFFVNVGEISHPMVDNHYIEWVAIETKNGFQVQFLKPGQDPRVDFMVPLDESVIAAYAYCNLHGLYKADY